VLDQEVRNKRLKQGYRKDLVPDNLDAIVIGKPAGAKEERERGRETNRDAKRDEKERERTIERERERERGR
jgi:hypothetical protein